MALILVLPFQLGHAEDNAELSAEDTASVSLETSSLGNEDVERLVTQLNAYITENPDNLRVWETLAQTYHQYGYLSEALYAAGEAEALGSEAPTIKKILLNDSVSLAEAQIQEGYTVGITEADAGFVKDYQNALSKTYGNIYQFNYDESLPKPRRTVRSYRAPKRAKTARPATTYKKSPARARYVAPKVRRKSPTVTAPKRPASKVSSAPRDPFKSVR